MKLRFYEIAPKYINFLANHESHIFHNSKEYQQNSRKYIGIILHINGINYFAPLSSFKEKHKKLNATVDFIKMGTMAVINLNNMIPVPNGFYKPVYFNDEKNINYRNLLRNEYRILKQISDLIFENAKKVYEHKIRHGNNSKLGKRCNDFLKLEKLCKKFVPK